MNIFENLPSDLPEELIEVLAEKDGLRIERILSRCHTSPDGFWYDQAADEFVILLKGRAIIEFEDRDVPLNPGDWLLIKAHERHRVAYTDLNTVWLAVHF